MRERRGAQGITVTGTGVAAAPVDQVTVAIAISETRQDAGEAFRAAAHTATRVLAILADDGADSRSVRTTDLTLGPRLEWRDNTEFVNGYQAGQRLVVQLTGLSGVERMLTDVATQGGNGVRIDSVTLTPSNPVAALRAARDAAVADARAKADQLAALAGRALGAVVWIDDRAADGVPARRAAGKALSLDTSSMPIAAGDSSVQVAVTMHWDFADRLGTP